MQLECDVMEDCSTFVDVDV